MVQLVKKNIGNVTSLAIGDGSNDVPMIKAANLGIGIMGVEGSEASANSDYAIAQFKYVHRLMFQHGRHYGHHMRNFVFLLLASGALVGLVTFTLAWYSAYSGLSPWEDVFWAVITVGIVAVDSGFYLTFDQDPIRPIWDNVGVRAILPFAYKENREKFTLTFKTTTLFNIIGILYGCFIFFIPAYATKYQVTQDGHDISGLYDLSSIIFISLGYAHYAVLILYFKMYTVFLGCLLLILYVLFFPTAFVINNSVPFANLYLTQFNIVGTP